MKFFNKLSHRNKIVIMAILSILLLFIVGVCGYFIIVELTRRKSNYKEEKYKEEKYKEEKYKETNYRENYEILSNKCYNVNCPECDWDSEENIVLGNNTFDNNNIICCAPKDKLTNFDEQSCDLCTKLNKKCAHNCDGDFRGCF
jgi:hypothetical protein